MSAFAITNSINNVRLSTQMVDKMASQTLNKVPFQYLWAVFII